MILFGVVTAFESSKPRQVGTVTDYYYVGVYLIQSELWIRGSIW